MRLHVEMHRIIVGSAMIVSIVAGCGGNGGQQVAAPSQTTTDSVQRSAEPDPSRTATTLHSDDGNVASLSEICRVSEGKLAALAVQASTFESDHDVHESPAEILAAVKTRASAAKDRVDCVAALKNRALRRVGCTPGAPVFPWMHCTFDEDEGR